MEVAVAKIIYLWLKIYPSDIMQDLARASFLTNYIRSSEPARLVSTVQLKF